MLSEGVACGRFAPSPSGRMHLGNIWSALIAWLAARSAGGKIFLRLEDLDVDRCKPQYCDMVMRDLEWLGLDWDGAPVYQSERTERYQAAFEQLKQKGLIYPCYCTRAERLASSAPHRSDGVQIYDGRCRQRYQEGGEAAPLHRKPAWRIEVPDEEWRFVDQIQGAYSENLRRDCGDFILRRSDDIFAYQLAVVVDDAEMGVTQVVRGSDLLGSTPRQMWLLKTLGYPQPEYAHLPLLLAQDGRRLAKRDAAQNLGELKQQVTAPQLVGQIATMCGLLEAYEPVMPEGLIDLFRWKKIPKTDILVKNGDENIKE